MTTEPPATAAGSSRTGPPPQGAGLANDALRRVSGGVQRASTSAITSATIPRRSLPIAAALAAAIGCEPRWLRQAWHGGLRDLDRWLPVEADARLPARSGQVAW